MGEEGKKTTFNVIESWIDQVKIGKKINNLTETTTLTSLISKDQY
jgi:hypothetical protein